MTISLRRVRRYVSHNILHADDSPHRIARGVFAGTLIAFLPLIGLQTAAAIGLAALLRGNKAICVPLVWITNPLTFIPLYSFCLWIGTLILPRSAGGQAHDELRNLLTIDSSVFSLEFWSELLARLAHLGVELWVGCFLVGLVCALVAYFVTPRLVESHRAHHRLRLQHRADRRLSISRRRAAAAALRETA